ncbi:MAG: amidohydrolase family protein [Proteobacteria bacterium]|nr:amidohydrolase family protein [Pseudomonadota bacterium]
MARSCVVRNGTVVFPEGGTRPADLLLADGVIAAILRPGEPVMPEAETIDAGGLHVFPGFIDAHVHFGYAEPDEEYTTETRYAANGGVTSIVAYLLHNESYREIFAGRRAECERRALVDFGFHFAASSEVHLAEMETWMRDYGVNSFKYFMQYKGEEGRYVGLDGTDDGFLYDLLQRAAKLGDPCLVVHPENIEVVNRLRRQAQMAGKSTLKEFCLAKPPFTEAENLLRAMYFAEHAGARIYIPHLSCAMGLEEARRYRGRYGRIHLETCPHYLTHTMDSDVGPIGKTNPPLRTQADLEAMWAGLADGSIEVVGSDHVPRKRATKEKNIWQASNGLPGTAAIAPVLFSEGYHKGRITLARIARVFSLNPARIFGLARRKGNIAVGMDADLTLVDLDRVKTFDPAELGSHSDYSLYEGWTMRGWPTMTLVRGVAMMKDQRIVGPAGHGRYLSRPLS